MGYINEKGEYIRSGTSGYNTFIGRCLKDYDDMTLIGAILFSLTILLSLIMLFNSFATMLVTLIIGGILTFGYEIIAKQEVVIIIGIFGLIGIIIGVSIALEANEGVVSFIIGLVIGGGIGAFIGAIIESINENFKLKYILDKYDL